jgi:hypothetical protein
LVLQQLTQIHFAFKVGLWAGGDGSENIWVRVPGGNDATTVVVIDDASYEKLSIKENVQDEPGRAKPRQP